MTILDNILSTKKKEIEISQSVVPMEKLQELSRDCKIRDFNKALSGKSMSVISEIKRKSPSAGFILTQLRLQKRTKLQVHQQFLFLQMKHILVVPLIF